MANPDRIELLHFEFRLINVFQLIEIIANITAELIQANFILI
jgi:hypothetical protein